MVNNPLRYSDPTGHRYWEGEGSITKQTIINDARRDKDFKDTTARNACQAGQNDHCSYAQNHPVETITFAATALVGGAAAEMLMLSGGAADLAGTAFWKTAETCIRSAVCRKVTGMVGGLNGMRLFRVWGTDPNSPDIPGTSPWGQSWSPVNPSTVNNLRNSAALPSGGASGALNTGRFVSEGKIIDDAGVFARDALALDGMDGGLLEIVIPNAIQKIQLINVSGANPPF